jgi:PepSY-associated TM region
MTRPKPLERRAGGRFRRWHAKIGLLATAFFFFLAVTGLMLNHTQPLGLDSRQISNSLITAWYGLRSDIPTEGFQLEDEYLVADGEKWLYGAKTIAQRNGAPIGAVAVGDLRYVATPQMLFLYQKDGRLVDKIDQAALPGWPIKRLGKFGERVALETKAGTFASADGVEWQTANSDAVDWAKRVPLPEAVRDGVKPAFAPSLPLERIVLDLHSGRLFGRYGPFVIDLIAVALMVLAATGLWIYFRAEQHRRRARLRPGPEKQI